jgi:hypothetical protein
MATCEACGNKFKARLAGYIRIIEPKTKTGKLLKVCPSCKGKRK